MIRTYGISLILTLVALPALAQTVLVRSGEHEGFTRLVLDFPERLDWQTAPQGNGVTVTFPGQHPVFDLSQAFDRLTQGRIAAIKAPGGSGKLDLTFGCACTTRTFWHSRSMLVVDILADAPDAAPVDALTKNPAEGAGFSGPKRPLTLRPENATSRLAALGMGMPPAMTTRGPLPTPWLPDDRLLAMRRTLLEQIAQSANQDLVQPARTRDSTGERWTPFEPLAATIADAPSDKAETIIVPPTTRALPLGPDGNLRVQGSTNLSSGSDLSSGPPRMTLTKCLPESFLDVATWGTQAPLQDQIGALYPKLSGEFDVIDPDVARQLARLYIYFGFGLEARQVLTLAATDAEDTPVLLELAAVVDDPDAGPTARRLEHDLGCSGFGAMWAVLAHEAIPEDQVLDHKAILRNFAELPTHLRQHLGPALARKLLSAKHQETSDMILRSIGRGQPSATAGGNIAKAALEIAQGDLDTADQTLQESLSRNDADTADVLVTMINNRISRDQGIAYDTAQLAGALYQENRGTLMGQRLGRSYLLALAGAQSYTEAFSEFDRVATDLSSEIAEKTREDMLRMLLLHAEDIAFMQQILNEPASSFATMPADLTRQVTKRVLTLGFANPAHDILRAAQVTDPEPAHRLLRAEIALAQGRPHRAEAEILGIVSPEADALRARSRTVLGDHAGATRYLEGLDDETATQHAAWLEQDWQKLLDSGDPLTSKLAHALTQKSPDKSGGFLAYNQGLIDQSVETRAALSELLVRTDISNLH